MGSGVIVGSGGKDTVKVPSEEKRMGGEGMKTEH